MKTVSAGPPSSFPNLLRGLEKDLDELCKKLSPEAGFTTFALESIFAKSAWPVGIDRPQPLAQWKALRRHDYAPELAAAGYFFSLGMLPDESKKNWQSGFSRLAERDAFPPDRCSFVHRPEELLGICLGAKCCLPADSSDLQRLHQVLQEYGRRINSSQVWDYQCFALSADYLGIQGTWLPLPSQSVHRWQLEEIALAVIASRVNKGDVVLEGFDSVDVSHLYRLVLEKFFSYDPIIHDGGKQAAIYGAVALSYQSILSKQSNMTSNSQQNTGTKVFIGHGRSPLWMELDNFLTKRLHLKTDEYNTEPTAGMTTPERLEAMLDDARFAFLVFTAEDEHHDQTKHARENVVHEQGLFQGRLGRRRAIILLEDGCTEFSNIVGQAQIRFPRGDIKARFEEIRRVLEREGLVKP